MWKSGAGGGGSNILKQDGLLHCLPTVRNQLCEARFKRRILHAPNLIAELSACKMRRLNQLNSADLY